MAAVSSSEAASPLHPHLIFQWVLENTTHHEYHTHSSGSALCARTSAPSRLLLADVCPAFAALRYYVDVDAILGLNTGASGLDAYIDLQSALANPACTEIWVAASTYKLTAGTDRNATFQLKNGVAIYGGFAGTETFRSARRPASNRTFLSGEIGDLLTTADNSVHVVNGSGTDATPVLNGFAITAGSANVPPGQGGGLYDVAGSPTLVKLIFKGNSAIDKGGAIFNNLSSSPTLTTVILRFNPTIDLGGGIYNDSSNPVITGATFTSNSAVSGGAIYNYNSNPALTRAVFNNNSADTGGGMSNDSSSSPSLKDVTFRANSATRGGGMWNQASSPTLMNVTFQRNSAIEVGGAIYNNFSNSSLTNVTLRRNSAAQKGGALYNESGASSLTNVTFSGNSAPSVARSTTSRATR